LEGLGHHVSLSRRRRRIRGLSDWIRASAASLLPSALAAWFGSVRMGLGIAVLSIAVSMLSDIAAGIPALGFWNAGMAFASYALFVGLLSKLRTLVGELDRRVQERTGALQREMAERQRLDREIAQVADRERRRLGQDLHDRLGQHLTGTALAAQVLKENRGQICVRGNPGRTTRAVR